jgi:hypothetical protein
MDIAATGLALPLLSPIRDRAQARPDSSQQARARGRDHDVRGSQAEVSGRNERVVSGEVIYARPETPRTLDRPQRSLSDAGFTSSGFRRFSMQAAVQTFRDNQALLTEPGQPRQISGIIDEYV